MDRGPCLLVFTKPPRPGAVKTRLIGDLTPEGAAELHAAFLGDLLDRLRGGAFALEIAWALAGEEEAPDLGFPSRRQEGDNLGERLHHALARAARRHSVVAAVGSDHPGLTRERIDEAFAHLRSGCDAVLGPAKDGGYYLIALRAGAVRPELFAEIPWSTDQVLSATRRRLAELGLRSAELATAFDVDTPADLRRLATALAGDAAGSPRTRALLERWGRLVPQEAVQ